MKKYNSHSCSPRQACWRTAAFADMLALEKEELSSAFIKLTDMATIWAVAYELGYFGTKGCLYASSAANGSASGRCDRGQWTARISGPVSRWPHDRLWHERHISCNALFRLDLNGNAIRFLMHLGRHEPNVPHTMDDGRPQHPISASGTCAGGEGYKGRGDRSHMGNGFFQCLTP